MNDGPTVLAPRTHLRFPTLRHVILVLYGVMQAKGDVSDVGIGGGTVVAHDP